MLGTETSLARSHLGLGSVVTLGWAAIAALAVTALVMAGHLEHFHSVPVLRDVHDGLSSA